LTHPVDLSVASVVAVVCYVHFTSKNLSDRRLDNFYLRTILKQSHLMIITCLQVTGWPGSRRQAIAMAMTL